MNWPDLMLRVLGGLRRRRLSGVHARIGAGTTEDRSHLIGESTDRKEPERKRIGSGWITLIVVGAVSLLAGARADAINYASSVSLIGDWNTPTSWIPVGVPTIGDTVTIAFNDIITVTGSHFASSVTISGELQIIGSGSLTTNAVAIPSGGLLQINGNGSPYAELVFSASATPPSLWVALPDAIVLADHGRITVAASMTFSGNGSINGLDSAAEISLLSSCDAEDVTLTSQILIRGALTIKESGPGRGYFANMNRVQADSPGGVLTLHSSLDGVADLPSPCGGACWDVSVANAVLRFDTPATGLMGSFRVGPGRLDVNKPVSTSGPLSIGSGGMITPALLVCFSFGGRCEPQCPLIFSPVCLPVRCH